MSVSPDSGGGGNVGTIIQIGSAIAKWGNRVLGTGESKRERAQWEAAEDVGYRTRAGRFPVVLDPQGQITTPDKARDVGRQVIVESGQTSKERAEADKEYRRARREEEAETREREREARKERERKREQSEADRINKKRPPGRLGRIVDATTAILVGTGAADVIRGVFDDEPQLEPRPEPPPPPPPKPIDLPPGAEWLPRGPFVPSSPPSSSPPLIEPPKPEPPPPKAEPPAPWEPLLLPVPVYSSPVPVPGPAPAPPSAPTAMPGGAPVPSGSTLPSVPAYQQALPWLLGAGLGLLGPSSGKRRRRDPLTVNQPDALGSLSLASFPLPFPGSGFGGYGAGTPSQQCECKSPSAKRRRKRKRTVCYSGTYTERASGLRKTKRRKVPCQ